MASQEAQLVVSIMKSARVTDSEALTFMAQVLTVMEEGKSGAAVNFVKELIERRSSHTMPDLWIRIR